GVRALALKDGAEVWHQATPQPAGQGAAGGARYYLPVRQLDVVGEEGQRGGIITLDLDTGRVVARLAPRSGAGPGNLIFHDGDLLSQGVGTVAVYPQLATKLARMEEGLRANPTDPVRL